MKPLTNEWLNQFRKASQIVRTGRDDKGNFYNNFGTQNQAAWIGEHAHLLIAEVDRLRKLVSELVELNRRDAP